ncbi:MAG: hypothetical protein QT05_C0017G0011 [archaeon GW2011_AR13]|nr:MAG: hypothetical protein QT05_C0017G0011 [archaeon GW2011_AR13]
MMKQKEKFHERVYSKTKSSAQKFNNEFKKQVATGVTAAFAFFIALSWRTPIENLINLFIKKFDFMQSAIYWEFLSAILVTIIAAVGLIFISRWSSEGPK